jgi:glycosyltransferase involved in cell wall biosynthesis
VWTQNPFAATLLAAFVDSKVIYDITDDWANLKGASRRFIERVKHGDAALTRRADCVIVCSKYLYELKKTVEVQPVLIPNGVDVAHYAWIGEPNAPSAAKMAEIQPPVLGYTGSLHEARLDIELVCALAAAQPHINLVLIGPSFLSVEAVARLTKFPNIHLIGPVPYRELPVYMQSFNALMIPHVVSDFTESLDPLKLYEYLAAGLPIVATNLAGVRDYAEVVRVAHSQTEFIEAVSLALNNRYSDEQAKARQLAQAASWHLRVDAVLQAISALEV